MTVAPKSEAASPPEPKLSGRFNDALVFASELHVHQTRKGKQVPYVAHLLSVAAFVLEAGGDEDMSIAALLHDAVEDQGGQPTLQAIRRRFGDRVARIVEACSDADSVPKPPWRQRKQSYIDRVRCAPEEVRLVSAADKLHNARAVLLDFREIGDKVFERFKGGKEGTLWYYRALVNAFREAGTANPGIKRLVEELARVVSELEHLAQAAR